MAQFVYFAAAIFALGLVGALVFLFRNARETTYLGAVDAYYRRQSKSYGQARRDLERLRRKIERGSGGSIVIDVIHDFGAAGQPRDNTPSIIEFEQAMDIMNALRSISKNAPVTVILHTLGGYSLAAEFIASAIKHHAGTTKIYVPYVAMSGGTIIALAGDRIYLGKNAALGPVDTQYEGYGFSTYKKVYDLKKEKTRDDVLMNYYEFEGREQSALDRVRAIIDDHHKKPGTDKLLNANLPHDHRITFDEAKGYDLNVENECPSEIYDYVELRLTMIRKYEDRGKSAPPSPDREATAIESMLITESFEQIRR